MLQVVGAAAAALVVGAHRYSNSNAVLVGAVELNAHWLLGTTEGTATEREKKRKKRHTSKKMAKEQKNKHTRDSLTCLLYTSDAADE